MSDRRSFIRQSAVLLGSLALHQNAAQAFPGMRPNGFDHATGGGPEDESFWRQIRQYYSINPSIINLNNGGVSPTPKATLDALDHYNRFCSEAPSYFMWRILDQEREPLRSNLARLAGVSSDEIAINRNATESLNTIVFGLDLKPGDEIVLSKYDYPNMMNAWRQREKRDGIKLVWVDVDLPSENEDYLVDAYVSKFTEKTKLVHLTHIVNWVGQILPVAKIADRAHAKGIEVLVDGAHSFALLDYKIPDLHCDYWGTSLHKFLCGPYGSGMMWIKKEKIPGIWPLMSNDKPNGENIRKFETLGTRSFPIEMAIGYSLDLHNLIGSARKQHRLHYLKSYLMDKLRDVPGVKFYTSPDPKWSCAICTVGLEGKKGSEISDRLFGTYKIHSVGIEYEKVNGVRITPNVYTLTEELDRMAEAIHQIAIS
jgi:selenocysteine lyase/cysteine desulfurase